MNQCIIYMKFILLFLFFVNIANGFSNFANINSAPRKYPLSKPIPRQEENKVPNPDYIPEQNETILNNKQHIRRYSGYKPKTFYEEQIRKLNSKNQTERDYQLLGEQYAKEYDENLDFLERLINGGINASETKAPGDPHSRRGGLRIVINKGMFRQFQNSDDDDDNDDVGGEVTVAVAFAWSAAAAVYHIFSNTRTAANQSGP